MKALMADTGQSRGAILKAPSLTRVPGSVSRRKLSKEIDELISETITDYVRAGGILCLPSFFKSVLKARIMKMILEQRGK